MHYDSGRDPGVALRAAEEAGLQGIALDAPTDERSQVVVEATANGIGKRRVRNGDASGAPADMGPSKQGVGKGAKLPHGERQAGTEKETVRA